MYKIQPLNFFNIYKAGYFVLICFILFSNKTTIYAQEVLPSSTINSTSYQLYTDKKWPELISFGNEAVQNGYDYFYMRMRIGVAYFEMKNYCLAELHFKKAIQFNTTDDLAKEYLYYCYVYTGKSEEARKLSRSFSVDLAKK